MKQLAKEKFGSVRRACQAIGMEEHTFHNIMRRGNSDEMLLIKVMLYETPVPVFDDDIPEPLIEEIRLMVGKSQKEFCKKYGIDEPSLSRILTGKAKRKSKKFIKLLNKLTNVNS